MRHTNNAEFFFCYVPLYSRTSFEQRAARISDPLDARRVVESFLARKTVARAQAS
jgi:hypothetical protein